MCCNKGFKPNHIINKKNIHAHIRHTVKMPQAPSKISAVIVSRTGELRVCPVAEYSQTELAKKCKHKASDGFEVRAEWAYSGTDKADNEKFMVELWAREDGKAGQENKYEFPPPVDTILFFGECALVAKDMTPQHNVIPLTIEKWEKMYNFLFGGFDQVDDDDDDDDDDENDSDNFEDSVRKRKTKDGYLKDGFVISDTSCDEEQDEDEEQDVDDDEPDEDEDDDEDESDDDADELDEDEQDEDDDDPDVVNGDDDDDDDDDDEAKIAFKKKRHAKTNTVVKKRIPKLHAKEEAVGPELTEESYEYSDD
jgi:hypothetical protein